MKRFENFDFDFDDEEIDPNIIIDIQKLIDKRICVRVFGEEIKLVKFLNHNNIVWRDSGKINDWDFDDGGRIEFGIYDDSYNSNARTSVKVGNPFIIWSQRTNVISIDDLINGNY